MLSYVLTNTKEAWNGLNGAGSGRDKTLVFCYINIMAIEPFKTKKEKNKFLISSIFLSV